MQYYNPIVLYNLLLCRVIYKYIQHMDRINPKYYKEHPSGVECIDITRHYCFSIGNAIKYLWRAGLKQENGIDDLTKEIEDLNKAIWYIQDRIKQLKEIQKQSVDEKETKEDNR